MGLRGEAPGTGSQRGLLFLAEMSKPPGSTSKTARTHHYNSEKT